MLTHRSILSAPRYQQQIPSIYQYETLRSSRSVRLIELELKDDVQPLSCLLTPFTLDNAPTYFALSYTWGDPHTTHSIAIDSGRYRIPITASLHNALEDLRACMVQEVGPPTWGIIVRKYVWADGICINQADSAEKEQQLRIMGEIYQKAFGTWTYIGRPSVHTIAGIRLAKQLHRLMIRWETKGDQPTTAQMHAESFYSDFGSPPHGLPPPENPAWAGLRELIDREWSSRVWIARESVLNNSREMYCGQHRLPPLLLGQIADAARNDKIPRFATEGCQEGPELLTSHQYLVIFHRTNLPLQFPRTFYHVLRLCHLFKSYYPEDKVLALLDLAPDRDKLAIPYGGTSAASLYIDVAVALLREYGSLDFLSSVHVERGSSTSSLPSWVPDWSLCAFEYEPFITNPTIIRYGLNRASGNEEVDFSVSEDRRTLTLKGYMVDRISHVNNGPKGARMPWFLFRQHIERLYNLPMYASERHAGTVFWKNLIVMACQKYNDGHEDALDTIFLYLQEIWSAEFTNPDFGEALVEESVHLFRNALFSTYRYRRFFTTENGYIGLGPRDLQVGDYACIFCGGPFVYVLRECGKGFQLIGESYIHGLMRGRFTEQGVETQWFDLI
jgi:hypothetical protein